MKRKLLSIVLTLTMLLSLLPTTALATSTEVTAGTYEALAGYLADDTTTKITLTGDIETTATLTVSKTITLDLAGFDITYVNDDGGATTASVITIESGGNLTLEDNGTEGDTGKITGGSGTTDITTSSGSTWDYRGGGVFLYNSNGATGSAVPTFNMYGGSITENSLAYSGIDYGAGVYTWGECAVVMTAGTISDNTGASFGGGVYISGDSTFVMTGGTIEGHDDTSKGGGVYTVGTFTMTGGTIKDNYASYSGGGVYAESVFTMGEDAIISNNKAGTYSTDGGLGGGVWTGSSSIFTMSGSISGNSASNYGGGVYATGDGSTYGFYMDGGTISGNTSADGGGGVYLKGDMAMGGGSIHSNTANGEGGGVYINDSGASLSMSGGTIGGSDTTGNTAGDGGGGVYIDKGGMFIMKDDDAVISYNEAKNTEVNDESDSEADALANDGNGGGVYISEGTFNMEGGTIEYNSAESAVAEDDSNGNGGGVYVNYNAATFNMTGGTISNNSAEYKGGGVYVYDQFNMNGTGALITNNTAAYGGGVYINTDAADVTENKAELVLSQGSITNNTATVAGGGVYGNTDSNFSIVSGTRPCWRRRVCGG